MEDSPLRFHEANDRKLTLKMKSSSTKSGRLGSYLTITVGAGTLAGTSEAAIVNLDLGPSGLNIAGVNAGLNSSKTTVPFPTGGVLEVYHRDGRDYTGLDGDYGLVFAISGGYASPRKFSAGDIIGNQISNWSGTAYDTVFRYGNFDISSDFGSGSFMGFRTAGGNYGWLEVTWDSASGNFEILSGAYEDVPGVAIQAGPVAAVPEPASVLGTLGLLSAGMFLRRRKRAA